MNRKAFFGIIGSLSIMAFVASDGVIAQTQDGVPTEDILAEKVLALQKRVDELERQNAMVINAGSSSLSGTELTRAIAEGMYVFELARKSTRGDPERTLSFIRSYDPR